MSNRAAGAMTECLKCGRAYPRGTDHQCPALTAVPMELPKHQLLALMTAAVMPYYTDSEMTWESEIEGAYHLAHRILERVAKG